METTEKDNLTPAIIRTLLQQNQICDKGSLTCLRVCLTLVILCDRVHGTLAVLSIYDAYYTRIFCGQKDDHKESESVSTG